MDAIDLITLSFHIYTLSVFSPHVANKAIIIYMPLYTILCVTIIFTENHIIILETISLLYSAGVANPREVFPVGSNNLFVRLC